MRIGIVTFHRADNYGAVLQNFALISALNRMGHEAYTIDYRCLCVEKNYQIRQRPKVSLKRPRSFLAAVKYPFSIQVEKARKGRFDAFRKERIPLTQSYTEEELLEYPPEFDAYIAGSDQIWNGMIVGGHNPIYTLEFAPKGKKIAYGASAGNSSLIPQESYAAIGGIDYILVRELELKHMIEQKIGKNATLCLDPVFLLSRNEWVSMIQDRECPRQIFLYRVGRGTQGVIDIAHEYARKNGGKIVYPMAFDMKIGISADCRFTAGPIEFLQLIRESEIVIASSFHAVAFSIIFEKQFIALPQKDTNSRIKDLLKMLGLENRMYESYEDYLKKGQHLREIDYDSIRSIITTEMENSRCLLEETLKHISCQK